MQIKGVLPLSNVLKGERGSSPPIIAHVILTKGPYIPLRTATYNTEVQVQNIAFPQGRSEFKTVRMKKAANFPHEPQPLP